MGRFILGRSLAVAVVASSKSWIVNSPFSCMGCVQRERTSLKGYFSLNDFYAWQLATGKIHRNNYHHGSRGPSLTGKTMSLFLIFRQGTHRNVKNR